MFKNRVKKPENMKISYEPLPMLTDEIFYSSEIQAPSKNFLTQMDQLDQFDAEERNERCKISSKFMRIRHEIKVKASRELKFNFISKTPKPNFDKEKLKKDLNLVSERNITKLICSQIFNLIIEMTMARSRGNYTKYLYFPFQYVAHETLQKGQHEEPMDTSKAPPHPKEMAQGPTEKPKEKTSVFANQSGSGGSVTIVSTDESEDEIITVEEGFANELNTTQILNPLYKENKGEFTAPAYPTNRAKLIKTDDQPQERGRAKEKSRSRDSSRSRHSQDERRGSRSRSISRSRDNSRQRSKLI